MVIFFSYQHYCGSDFQFMVKAIKRPQQLSTIKRRYNIDFITYAIMTELDCPTCHQRYTIPEEMKNHVEQVHQLNKAYMDLNELI